MIDSTDGRLLNNAINPNNVLPDSQRSNVGIQVRTGGVTRYQQHEGPASHRQNATQVQLHQDDGLVRVPGTPHEVRPEVLESLKKSAPQLFVPEAEKAAQAATEAAADAKEEAIRADLARHSDDQAEAAHMMFVSEVPAPEAIALLVQMHRDGAPSASTLHKVSESMGLTSEQGVTTLNKMAAGVQNQLSALATAHGVDADAFAGCARHAARKASRL
jgi:hypothetical protein